VSEEIAPPVPCIVFALKHETGPFFRACESREMLPEMERIAWRVRLQGRNAIVLIAGVGILHSTSSMKRFFQLSIPINRLIMAGFAGGLTKTLQVSDVVVPRAIVDESGETWKCEGTHTTGRILTTTRMIGDPAEKMALAEKYQSIAVDMESSVIAKFAATHHIPFQCLRAITDTVDEPISQRVLSLIAGGRIRPSRVIWAIVTSPSIIREFYHLAKASKRASEALAIALTRLLSTSLET